MLDVNELMEEMLEKYGAEAMAQVAEQLAADSGLLERTITEVLARHSEVTEPEEWTPEDGDAPTG